MIAFGHFKTTMSIASNIDYIPVTCTRIWNTFVFGRFSRNKNVAKFQTRI